MANWGRDFRTKEWEAFQLGNDEWFVLGAVYNAKVVGIVMVIAVHQASGRRLRWINKVPARSVEVARGLERSVSRGGSRRSALTITNALADGRIDLDGHHAGRNSLPLMSLTGTGLIDEDTRHLAVCHPFPSDRILYTNKVLVPFTGVLSIGEETITFDVWIVAVCPGKSATDARAAVHNIADAMSGYFRTGSGWTLGGTACTGVFYPLKYKPGLSDKARSGLMRAELTATINRLS